MTDPWKVLGVEPSADEETVNKAYKTLARKYHPDLNPGDKEAEAKMKEINSAYDAIKSGKASAHTAANDPYGDPYGTPYGSQRPYGGGQGGGWIFTPFGVFYMGGDRTGTRRKKKFSFLRLLLILMLLRSLLYSCSYYGNLRGEPPQQTEYRQQYNT